VGKEMSERVLPKAYSKKEATLADQNNGVHSVVPSHDYRELVSSIHQNLNIEIF
jgi:hypothetical protein